VGSAGAGRGACGACQDVQAGQCGGLLMRWATCCLLSGMLCGRWVP
jgi:hypothetical protein